MEHEVFLLVRLSLDIAERGNDESACMGLESYRVLFQRAHGSYRVLFLNLLLHLVLVAGMDRLLLLDCFLLMIFCWIDISSLVEFWRLMIFCWIDISSLSSGGRDPSVLGICLFLYK
jgi:hypothetical protein